MIGSEFCKLNIEYVWGNDLVIFYLIVRWL